MACQKFFLFWQNCNDNCCLTVDKERQNMADNICHLPGKVGGEVFSSIPYLSTSCNDCAK